MDGSKQLLSNSMLHIMNVWLSVVVGNTKQHDQCGIYFMSLVIDVTLGLAITYGLVVLSNRALSVAFTKVSRLHAAHEKWQLLQGRPHG